MLDEKQINLIFSLAGANNEGSRNAFLQSWPIDAAGAVALGEQLLRLALVRADSIGVDCGIILIRRFGRFETVLDVLHKLARERWHTSHENIARILGDIRDSSSVEALAFLAKVRLPYLAYDDFFGLAVHSIWALGNIGNLPAVVVLAGLMHRPETVIARNAAEQLVRLSRSEERDIAERCIQELQTRPENAAPEEDD